VLEIVSLAARSLAQRARSLGATWAPLCRHFSIDSQLRASQQLAQLVSWLEPCLKCSSSSSTSTQQPRSTSSRAPKKSFLLFSLLLFSILILRPLLVVAPSLHSPSIVTLCSPPTVFLAPTTCHFGPPKGGQTALWACGAWGRWRRGESGPRSFASVCCLELGAWCLELGAWSLEFS